MNFTPSGMMPMPTTLNQIDLQDLSSVYDDRDTYLTLYLDLRHGVDLKFLEKRKEKIARTLKRDRALLDAFEKNCDALEDALKMPRDPGSKGLAFFVSIKNGFRRLYHLPLPMDNQIVVDTSPYIRPLARLRDEWETYALILIDTGHAKLYVVSSGLIVDEISTSKNIMNKHKKGGFSQMRFQRLRRGAIEKFYKLVAEKVEDILESEAIKKIILAGPGQAKIQFQDHLSPKLRSKVVEIMDVDLDINLSKLVDQSAERVAEEETRTSHEAVKLLRKQILKNGLGVYGLNETLEAVQGGRAELLLVDKDYLVAGWICENCQLVRAGTQPDQCPICEGPTSQVDVIEELIEFAERIGTALEFVGDNELLEELGGVGALLRF